MKKPIVLAYRASWQDTAGSAARIAYRPLTHIAHSFAVAEKNVLTFPGDATSRDLVQTAHKNGVKVTIAIGGAESNKNLSALCATDVGTKALAKSVAAQIKAIGYDGADVDWEHPENADDTNRLSRFVAALRAELPRPLLLTMAAPSTDWSGRWYDAPAIIPHLDWVAVMCYDFYGTWSDTAGRHAPLFAAKGTEPVFSASVGMEYWNKKKHFPAEKLVLGIPVYARGFRTKNWGDPVPNAADKNIEAAYRTLGASVTDRQAVCATWTAENGAVLLSGDNAETARIKGEWARKQGYGGVFFWELSQDSDNKTSPSVIVAAAKGFGV